MSPFGHIAFSYIIGKSNSSKFSISYTIIGGILPDIDFILLPFGWFNKVHRIITHNIFFVIVVSLIGALSAGSKRVKIGLSILTGGLSHLLVDSNGIMGTQKGDSVAIFWPFSKVHFTRYRFIPPPIPKTGWQKPLENAKRVMKTGMKKEMPIYLAATFIFMLSTLCLVNLRGQTKSHNEN